MTEAMREASQRTASLLAAAGWSIQDADTLRIPPSGGVAVRNVSLSRDYGRADYLLYIDGKVAGLIEIDIESAHLHGIDPQAEKYRRGLPILLPVYTRPLPFLYQSDGKRICFTNAFDAPPQARPLFAFHKAETLKVWLEEGMIGSLPRDMAAAASIEYGRRGATLQERLCINMPPLEEEKHTALHGDAVMTVEQSLRKNHSRVLLHMPDGAARRSAALHLLDRLLRFADARRVLFLVNSANLVREVQRAFQDYRSPYGEKNDATLFKVSDQVDFKARVCITTLPRIYGLIHTDPLPQEAPMRSPEEIFETVAPLHYNPDLPIETFDIVLIDTCSAPLTRHFRRVLDYFDAYVIGMTGETDTETAALFDENVVGGDEEGGLNVVP